MTQVAIALITAPIIHVSERNRDLRQLAKIRAGWARSDLTALLSAGAQLARLSGGVVLLHALAVGFLWLEADEIRPGDFDAPVGVVLALVAASALRWRRLRRWERFVSRILLTRITWLGDKRDFAWHPADEAGWQGRAGRAPGRVGSS